MRKRAMYLWTRIVLKQRAVRVKVMLSVTMKLMVVIKIMLFVAAWPMLAVVAVQMPSQ